MTTQGLVKTQVVVLHRHPFSDSSMVVKAFSPDLGLVSMLAKGLRRKDSRMRSALEPLVHSEVVLAMSPRRELQIPREATVVSSWMRLRSDLLAWAEAEVMAEAVLRFAAGGSHHDGVFQLLLEGLERLEAQNPDGSLLSSFLGALAAELGYAFSLSRCCNCGAVLDGPPGDLDPRQGGGVCLSCLGTRRASWPQYLRESLYLSAHGGVPEVPALRRHEEFFLHYLALHQGLSQPLRSLGHLAAVRGLSSPAGERNAR